MGPRGALNGAAGTCPRLAGRKSCQKPVTSLECHSGLEGSVPADGPRDCAGPVASAPPSPTPGGRLGRSGSMAELGPRPGGEPLGRKMTSGKRASKVGLYRPDAEWAPRSCRGMNRQRMALARGLMGFPHRGGLGPPPGRPLFKPLFPPPPRSEREGSRRGQGFLCGSLHVAEPLRQVHRRAPRRGLELRPCGRGPWTRESCWVPGW